MQVQPSIVLTAFVTLFVLQTAAVLWLEHLNQKAMRLNLEAVPAELAGYLDTRRMLHATRYSLAKSRLDMAGTTAAELTLLAMLLSGGLVLLDALLTRQGFQVVSAGIVFFLAPGAILYAVYLPFGYYRTFVVEERFGFNRSTRGLFLLDQLKSTLLSTLILSLILAVVLWIIEVSPAHWWIWGFLVVSLVQIILVALYPRVIAPLFNEFQPVQDPALATAITGIMAEHGITIKRILQMNAGLRSRHTNAYFTGLGKTKQIVLFDTLLESHPQDEILAILAHEVGHFKEKHVLKQIVLTELSMLVGLYGIHLLLKWPPLYAAFGFTASRPYVGLFLLGILWQKLGFFLQPFYMAISRRFERDADRFAAAFLKTAEPSIAALRRLAVDNLTNLTPNPWYVRFHYSHPPLVERIRLLRKCS